MALILDIRGKNSIVQFGVQLDRRFAAYILADCPQPGYKRGLRPLDSTHSEAGISSDLHFLPCLLSKVMKRRTDETPKGGES